MKQRITHPRAFSIASSGYILLFLIVNNIVSTPFPWVLFCIPPLVIWPLAVCRPHLMASTAFAFILSGMAVAYYALLNIVLAQGHPWALYVGFAVAWYPFSLLLARKGGFAYSLFGLIWSVLFFGMVNFITTPTTIWAVFPVFSVMWWPLSVYFFAPKATDKC